MANKDKIYEFLEGGCPTSAFEEMDVTVPVAVHAYANVGNVVLSCMGPFTITRNSDRTPGEPDAVSRFTVCQRLRVDIPIVFGAETEVGEGHVYFASSDLPTGNDPCKCMCNY